MRSGWRERLIGAALALLLAIIAAGRGPAAKRIVAAQMASAVSVLIAVVLIFVDDQPSTVGLALVLSAWAGCLWSNLDAGGW